MKVYVYFLVLSMCTPISSHDNSENILQQDLTDLTSKFNIPIVNRSKAISVTFGIELISLLSVVEQDQMIAINVWVRMSWINERSIWNPLNYSNRTATKLSTRFVWTPDIVLKEDISDKIQTFSEMGGTSVVLAYNGTSNWFIPANFVSSCQFDTTDFPFDHQVCVFTFGSWLHNNVELELIPDERPIVSNNYMESDAWLLNGAYRKLVMSKYECCPNPYTEIQYTIKLCRKTKYYLETLLYPCIVQIFVVLCAFFLPPESGERIEVILTVLLVFAVYLGVICNYLPRSSGSAPILTNFYFAILFVSAFALIASCFVVAVHYRGMEKGVPPMAKWMKMFFIDWLSEYLCIGRNLRTYRNEDLLALKHIKRKNNSLHEQRTLMKKSDSELDISEEENDATGPAANTVVKEVGVISSLIHDFNRQDEIEEEWQILGKVFDRLFFIIFFVIYLVTCLVSWIPVYLRYKQ